MCVESARQWICAVMIFSIPSARPSIVRHPPTAAPPSAGTPLLKKINFLSFGLFTLSQWQKFRANWRGIEDSFHLLKLPALLSFIIKVANHLFLLDTRHQIFRLWSSCGAVLEGFEEQVSKADTHHLFWFSK